MLRKHIRDYHKHPHAWRYLSAIGETTEVILWNKRQRKRGKKLVYVEVLDKQEFFVCTVEVCRDNSLEGVEYEYVLSSNTFSAQRMTSPFTKIYWHKIWEKNNIVYGIIGRL